MNRTRWAEDQLEDFIEKVETFSEKLDIKASPIQYVKLYQLCVQRYGFAYPSEYKVIDIISIKDNSRDILELSTCIMKNYRLQYQKYKKTMQRK